MLRCISFSPSSYGMGGKRPEGKKRRRSKIAIKLSETIKKDKLSEEEEEEEGKNPGHREAIANEC